MHCSRQPTQFQAHAACGYTHCTQACFLSAVLVQLQLDKVPQFNSWAARRLTETL